MEARHVPVVGRAIAGKANRCDWSTLERLGYVATMKDGRKVVTLPARDEYFRLVNRKGTNA